MLIIIDQTPIHGAHDHRRTIVGALLPTDTIIPEVQNQVGLPLVTLLLVHGNQVVPLGRDHQLQLHLLRLEIGFSVIRWHNRCRSLHLNLLILGRRHMIAMNRMHAIFLIAKHP